MDTKMTILNRAKDIYSTRGAEGISMRTLASEVGITQSVLYYYFKNKQALLKEMFDLFAKDLGKKRAVLPQPNTASEMLKQRINFQLENSSDVVMVLKYFLSQRSKFAKNPHGYVPETAYRHIKEVLEYGKSTGEFTIDDIDETAKVITHAINGFVLEYFPNQPKGAEKQQLVHMIHKFLIKALTKGGESN